MIRPGDAIAAVRAFVEERLVLCIALTAALLILLVTIGVVSISRDAARSAAMEEAAAERRKLAVPADEIILPEEPLPLPGVEQYRARRSTWSADDAKGWYTVPDGDSLGSLREVNRSKIRDLWGSAP